ncbi:MAG: type IV pilus biogenesis/stability protein PilW [Wenzhouxiangellaceae bacterium]|nr:type IV pilus biogenesis/stability protein PilW [Wenzhouxiangellaceae bacterium]
MTRLIAMLVAGVLAGCASNAEMETRRSGSAVERVSPVRAAEVNTRLGVGYLERGDLQVAMEKLELATRQDPNHSAAWLALGVVYERIGRIDQAVSHLATAVRLAPNDGGARNSYGAMLCQAGRFDEADRQFRAALEDPFYSTPEEALANAGSCARQAGRIEQAERYLRGALEFRANHPMALYSLALLSFESDRALQARAFMQRLENTGALGPDALMLGWRIEQALGSEADAAAYASRIQQQFPQSPQASELRRQRTP